jgi:POT family proton-dependent oligopeptide transporter
MLASAAEFGRAIPQGIPRSPIRRAPQSTRATRPPIEYSAPMSAASTAVPSRPSSPVAGGRELFGHPIGLSVLFFTEMWERFCFYGMRALLALYVAHHLARPDVASTVPGFYAVRDGLERVFGKLDDEQFADQIYGLYTAFVYLTPLFGGILADRWLGQRKSVFIGAVVMAVGEFMLMRDALFFPALVVLIVGVGFLKSNISTQVGALYSKGDERRDRAFNVFYVGINLGAWLSPYICGTLGQSKDAAGNEHWAWGFGSAGVGMLVGIAIYSWGQKYLAPDQIMTRAPKSGVADDTAARAAMRPFTKAEWARIVALVVLCALNISFWGVYEQQGNSLQFWADGKADLHILRWLGSDWEMPSTWFQSVNPMFIFLLTPLVNPFWAWLAKRGKDPSSVAKMAIGCFLLGVSFLVMIGGGKVVDSGHKASFAWLVGCSFLLTLGEIYLSPVGLSLVTKIAPVRIVSMMMGMWFLSSFFGNYMSGYVATFANKMSNSAFFLLLAVISLATGVLMIVLYAPLKKAIGDENAKA